MTQKYKITGPEKDSDEVTLRGKPVRILNYCGKYNCSYNLLIINITGDWLQYWVKESDLTPIQKPKKKVPFNCREDWLPYLGWWYKCDSFIGHISGVNDSAVHVGASHFIIGMAAKGKIAPRHDSPESEWIKPEKEVEE